MSNCARKSRHISMLSGGQLQRVLIARAIVRDPELLLMDEPLSNIDAGTQKSIYELFLELGKRMSVVFVTHDISAISTYVEKVACLNGKLFYHGPKEGSLGKLEDAYGCPIEMISHGVPHRVLKRHSNWYIIPRYQFCTDSFSKERYLNLRQILNQKQRRPANAYQISAHQDKFLDHYGLVDCKE